MVLLFANPSSARLAPRQPAAAGRASLRLQVVVDLVLIADQRRGCGQTLGSARLHALTDLVLIGNHRRDVGRLLPRATQYLVRRISDRSGGVSSPSSKSQSNS